MVIKATKPGVCWSAWIHPLMQNHSESWQKIQEFLSQWSQQILRLARFGRSEDFYLLQQFSLPYNSDHTPLRAESSLKFHSKLLVTDWWCQQGARHQGNTEQSCSYSSHKAPIINVQEQYSPQETPSGALKVF